ncbi:MAG: hypothetical protein WCZ00_02625 [Acholeplasmataceae bacterium]
MPELTFILATLATIIFIAFVMTAAKLAMYMFFSFMYPKKIWIDYLIFHTIMLIFAFIPIAFFPDISNGSIILAVSSPILIILAVVEYFYFYYKHFDYESKKKYLLSLFISYWVNFLILTIGMTLYFAVLVFIGALE